MMRTSSPFWRFSLRARAASWAMEMPPVSSMYKGVLESSLAQMVSFAKSASVISPRLILLEDTSACSEMILVASCSEDISSEKNPTTPPSRADVEPSGATSPL